MKFLVDNALSITIARGLTEMGYDALHVREIQMQDASDERIFDYAKQEGRIIISADTDFSMILALRKESYPSLVLFRKGSVRHPIKQIELLRENLPGIIDSLNLGCVVVIEEERIRIRRLPFID